MPRAPAGHPKVAPDGSVNLAFLGQFAETPRNAVFTTGYSVCTAMEAVYTLCGVERTVAEVSGGIFDVRLAATGSSGTAGWGKGAHGGDG